MASNGYQYPVNWEVNRLPCEILGVSFSCVSYTKLHTKEVKLSKSQRPIKHTKKHSSFAFIFFVITSVPFISSCYFFSFPIYRSSSTIHNNLSGWQIIQFGSFFTLRGFKKTYRLFFFTFRCVFSVFLRSLSHQFMVCLYFTCHIPKCVRFFCRCLRFGLPFASCVHCVAYSINNGYRILL